MMSEKKAEPVYPDIPDIQGSIRSMANGIENVQHDVPESVEKLEHIRKRLWELADALEPFCSHHLSHTERNGAQGQQPDTLNYLAAKLQEKKSHIESTRMGGPASERNRGRIIGILDALCEIDNIKQSQDATGKDPAGTTYDSGSGRGWTKIPPASPPGKAPDVLAGLDEHTLLKIATKEWFSRDKENDFPFPNDQSWWKSGWVAGYLAALRQVQQQ